jgi:poly(A) polymerase
VEPAILERAAHPISRHDIDANVLKVLYRLINADHLAYLVGGGVRDLMMGRRPKDFDVATSAHPHEVRGLFRNSRLIGRRFRLVHVFFGAQNIEVSTFRRHSEDFADGGDPMIQRDNTFGSPEEDAFRRDFTVNALFYDPRSFRVIDYIGGVPDLRARLIRTVGDPELRMREDPIRMIRAVRFAAKLGFEIEPATRAAIERHCGDLVKASVPRLVEETFRTLALADAPRALALLQRFGLLEMMLPALSCRLKSDRDTLEASPVLRNLTALGQAIAGGVEPSRALVLATLFADSHLSAAELSGLVAGLRVHGFSRADTETMSLLLHALTHMLTPSRITRRLARRPFFAEARQLYEWVAPSHGADLDTLDAFLAAPQENHAPNRTRHAPHAALGTNGTPSRSGPPRRRYRGRGGRRRRRGSGVAQALQAAVAAAPIIAPGAASQPAKSPAATGEGSLHAEPAGGELSPHDPPGSR